eukprot:m.113735 g.113735  ORF g.113735 m.113735 type:complete len:76 (+) comp19327_c0_seq4:57-284(+)
MFFPAVADIGVTMICPGPVVSEGAQNSFTAKAGEVVGEYNVDDRKKMKTERCAALIATAIANKLPEVHRGGRKKK